jgi:glycosyltransferase involved in cell wall biosynthesis
LVILLSAFACLPNYGTESGNGWNWATHLVEAGHTVYVLTRAVNKERIEKFLSAHPIENLYFLYVEVPFASIFRHRDRGLYYLVWQMEALKAAKKLIKKVNFDIVHHVTYGSVHVPSPLWRLGLPIVFGPVGGGQTAPANMLHYFGSAKRQERQRSFITKLIPYSPLHRSWLQHMSCVLATNRDTLELVKRCGSHQVEFSLDFGLPRSFFVEQARSPSDFDGPLRLLWVGRVLPRKGLALALDALLQVKQDFHLTIVGDGETSSPLPEMIRERSLGEKITNLGRLPWNETREQYLKHHCLLFTSLRDSTGAQMLEAMACGLPVVCLDLHGARDIVTQGAGYRVPVTIPKDTAFALAQTIDRYALLSKEERAEMSQCSLVRARSLEWHERVRNMNKYYSTAIQKPGNRH